MAVRLKSARRPDIAAWMMRLLEAHDLPLDRLAQVRPAGGHSNEIYEVALRDGRVLLVKRARHEWLRAGFAASAAAARLIGTASDIAVPRPLPPTAGATDPPVQAYWRIPLPTLASLWPTLSAPRRADALFSLGRLLRRLHAIPAPGWGPLHRDPPAAALEEELDRDLRQRLLPAVIAHWPAGVASLETLIARVPAAARIRADTAPVLVHTDLHLGNVLCSATDDRIECVGFLDLDGAAGGCVESDHAVLDVLHGPLFQWPIAPALRRHVRSGYAAAGGDSLDDRLLAYFRCAHLVNQGFSSALLRHDAHAAGIAHELRRRLAGLNARLGGATVRGVHR